MPDKNRRSIVQPLSRPIWVARLLFVLVCTWLGSFLAWDTRQDPRFFSLIGFMGGLLLVLIEYSTKGIASRKIVLTLCGWTLGLLCGQLFYTSFGTLASLALQVLQTLRPRELAEAVQPTPPKIVVSPAAARLACDLIFGYFGLVLALRHMDWLRLGNLKFYLANPADRPKILDTSIIIDGRILDVVALGLFNGPVLVPAFVLGEVQALADSADPGRRVRGRRGLDVLEKLGAACKTLDMTNVDYPTLTDVDQKLVRLCQEMNGELVTNDFNLQKIAEFNQIQTINLNQLAAALRPTVYIGESLSLRIAKAGKEFGQGVGYLEDGAMVVIEGGESLIGTDAEVVVTGIIQNPTGRLIFARVPTSGRAHPGPVGQEH